MTEILKVGTLYNEQMFFIKCDACFTEFRLKRSEFRGETKPDHDLVYGFNSSSRHNYITIYYADCPVCGETFHQREFTLLDTAKPFGDKTPA